MARPIVAPLTPKVDLGGPKCSRQSPLLPPESDLEITNLITEPSQVDLTKSIVCFKPILGI